MKHMCRARRLQTCTLQVKGHGGYPISLTRKEQQPLCLQVCSFALLRSPAKWREEPTNWLLEPARRTFSASHTLIEVPSEYGYFALTLKGFCGYDVLISHLR